MRIECIFFHVIMRYRYHHYIMFAVLPFLVAIGCGREDKESKRDEVVMDLLFVEYIHVDDVKARLGEDYTEDHLGFAFPEGEVPKKADMKSYLKYMVVYEKYDIIYKFNFYDELIGAVKIQKGERERG